MEFAKHTETGFEILYCENEDSERRQNLIAEGYRELVRPVTPLEPGEGQVVVDDYVETEGKIKQKWRAIPDTAAIKVQIDQLKAIIANLDYMVIKCYEYNLVDKPLPYDISALHEERESLREQIRALELKL